MDVVVEPVAYGGAWVSIVLDMFLEADTFVELGLLKEMDFTVKCLGYRDYSKEEKRYVANLAVIVGVGIVSHIFI